MQPDELSARVAALNTRYRHHGATDVLARALRDTDLGRLALVSSFGAESVVLLHLVAVTAPDTPVIFIDTGRLFAETLVYSQELAERLGLTNLRIHGPDPREVAALDPHGALYTQAADACCALRKTRPLNAALSGFDGWITGRKRYQAGSRAALQFFEAEAGTGRIKVNPLAHWAPADLRDYMEENRLPRHPLVARGYPSIGCAPCTGKVAPSEDPRAGRWRGQAKTECGIHLVAGQMQRKGEDA